MMRAAAILSVPLLLLAGPARAGSDQSALWSRAVEPTAYEQHMHDGDEASILAATRSEHGHGAALARAIESAVHEYELAAEADPSQGEPHYRAAELIYAYWVAEQTAPDPDITRRAIEHWRAFERLSPRDPRLDWALFRRSIAYTKLGGEENLRAAVADYEAQLRLTDESTPDAALNAALVLSNAAELYMAVGELDESITLYLRALELNDRALYGYGLALALDRDGQGVKAREVMRNYALSDKLKQLTEDHVFFIPEGEIHAYLALGYDALGDVAKAIENYQAYLRFQPASRYSKRATARLAELRERPRSARGKPHARSRHP